MLTRPPRFPCSSGFGPAIILMLAGVTAVRAQTELERKHIELPPAVAGTPLSFQIQAEAEYVAAVGYMEESVAIARKIHAEAVALEIQNSIDYVDAYFRRREINREWREKQRPNSPERREEYHRRRQQQFETQFQDVLKGDATLALNWLLAELSRPALAFQYMSESAPASDTLWNGELPTDAAAQIWFTDTGHGRNGLVFRAAAPKVLDVPWPLALRAERFAPMRNEFQKARDRVVNAIRSRGEVDAESSSALIKTINSLLVALDEAYPKEERFDPMTRTDAFTARRYLRCLAVQAHRTLHTRDPALFDGTLGFEGSQVFELVVHMNQRGLVFAPPQPGGERVYRGLLSEMRRIYLELPKTDQDGKEEAG